LEILDNYSHQIQYHREKFVIKEFKKSTNQFQVKMEQEMPEQESFIGDKSANKEKTLQCSPKFIQNCILVGMERIFYNHGKRVSRHPFCYIALCLAITFICGTGLIWFRQENNGIRLFIPEKSDQR
jgi:hypothetical protein